MDEETIAAAPSAENGNASVETEPEIAPSEPVVEETPAQVEEPTTDDGLAELPDGRRVDAATAAEEYRNLLSEFTRKSQELAAVKAPIIENKPTDPSTDPNYVPQSYAELLQVAEERALRAIEAKGEKAAQARQALEEAVATQLAEVKAADPSLNETALFAHATKYGFRDLKVAHQNLKDMNETMKKVQSTTAANIARRSDPVSVSPGATGAKPNPSDFRTATEYLRSLK